jgi:hypothetical protein
MRTVVSTFQNTIQAAVITAYSPSHSTADCPTILSAFYPANAETDKTTIESTVEPSDIATNESTDAAALGYGVEPHGVV